MTTSKQPTVHVLLAAAPAMGHGRGLVGLASKFVRQRPGSVTVTIPTAGDIKYLYDQELERYFPSEEDQSLKEDIHIISLGGVGSIAPALFPHYMEAFPTFYTSLENVTPFQCASGQIHTFNCPPTVVVADFFMYSGMQSIRQISKRKIPILCWLPGFLSALLRLLGPEELGGLGDIVAKAKALSEKSGRPAAEHEFELSYPEAGEVVQSPGMPPMFDYEYYPQKADTYIRRLQVPLHLSGYRILMECDGVISGTSAAFDPEAVEATRAWYAQTGRPLYCVGPVLPDDVLGETPLHANKTKTVGLDLNDQRVLVFIDKVYKTYGENSLLYVSFGTLFWPKSEALWKVIEDILDSNRPFLLTYDTRRLEKMPENVATKFKTSDRAMYADWIPQQFALKHPATGFFMTHCGYNSIMEAIVFGVPMIAYPLDAEQPGVAAYVSVKLDVAYELIEGRSALGLKPMYRGVQPKGTEEAFREEVKSVLKDAFGEGGKHKRENIRAYQKKVVASMKEGGDLYRDILRFMDDYLNV